MTDDGWIKWPGIEAFPAGVREALGRRTVYIRYADGFEKPLAPDSDCFRYAFMWKHEDNVAVDIVAYKIEG